MLEAFTNDADLARWSAPKGLDVAQGSIDLRVGGRWMVVMHDPSSDRRYHAEGGTARSPQRDLAHFSSG